MKEKQPDKLSEHDLAKVAGGEYAATGEVVKSVEALQSGFIRPPPPSAPSPVPKRCQECPYGSTKNCLLCRKAQILGK